MRILITNTGPWGTGSFTVADAILKEFIKLGHEVLLFFPDTGFPSEDLELYYGNKSVYHIWKFPIQNEVFRLESFPLMIPDPHPRVENSRTYRSLSEGEFNFYYEELRKELVPIVKQFKPDIVECQHIWTMDKVIDELKLPYICTAHHSDQLGFDYDPRMRPIAIEAAQHAEKIFAISKSVQEEVVRLYGVPEEKVKILTNGYDRSLFYPQPLDRQEVFDQFGLKIPIDATLFSFTGKISKTKGIDVLLKANKKIHSDQNIHYLILGSGKLEEVLDIDDMDQYDFTNVHFLGHHTMANLAKIHNIADFGMLPSRSEGFGIACLEAMACGLPMISTTVGGLKDFVVGKLVPPANDDALANAILELAHLPQPEREALSKQALATADTFSWESIAETRLQHYEEILQKRSAA